MDLQFNELITQLITIVSGIIFTAISTLGAFYMKRLSDKAKLKTLKDEVNRYVSWALQASSFKLLTAQEKNESVFMKAKEFAEDNDIKVSDSELALMVERAVQSLSELESIGLKLRSENLMKLKGEG